MRCFIAIDFPELLKKAINDCVRQLKPLSRDVRWVASANLHLTLKFLGEVPESRISMISGALHLLSQSFQPFSIDIVGAGAFPNERRPNVFWVGIKAEEPLLSLQSRLEDTMSELGFQKERRGFVPHLTIGLVKGYQDMSELMSRFLTFQNTFFGSIEVHEIVLMQSILKPSGAVYAKAGEFSFRQGGNPE